MAEYITAPHAFVKAGVFYFNRRVPKDLRDHYKSPRVSFSLRTKSASVASARAAKASEKLDEYWYHLRVQRSDLPGKHLLRMASVATVGQLAAPAVQLANAVQATGCVKLSEAVSIYLRLKGKGRPATFQRSAERSCGYAIDVCGDKDITSYTKADANAFRNNLLKRDLTGSSVSRIFGTVKSVVNFAASESGVTINNPFVGVYFDHAAGVEDREPIALDSIRDLQLRCRNHDDDLRWLVALVSDTGLRLAEAAGLLKEDFKLDGTVPHVIVKEHPWRRLKTSGSARLVPLVGTALWAATRILATDSDNSFAFPRYNKLGDTNANSASAALNKWLRPFVAERCTMHSFRHSMRDRLRAVECPADVVDQIGGWQTEGVGQGYGKGYPLEVLARWMKKME